MTFLYPMMLWALALPLLLAVLAILKLRRAGSPWRQLVSAGHEAALVVKTPVWRRILPTLFTLLALTCGIVSAARPINGYTNTEALATGRNLLIALDISRSMETQDVKPSRLEEARAAAFELVDALPGDKIGLIVFSGEADLVVPLTYDHTALRDALEQVNRGWAGYGGTNFGLVLNKAMQDFERSAPTGTNALVIFSDGEDTVGSSLDIARQAKEKNLLVITVGVGTSVGDSIPDARGENGLYQDANGKHVISKLDAAALRRFAEATGGDYFTMGSGADLTSFARQAVDKLDRHEESFAGHKVPRDLFAPFALAALLLLAAAALLGTEWRPVRRVLSVLLLLPALLPQAKASPETESLRAYEEALTHMETDADKAREGFSRALLDEDADIQAACHYELGNLSARTTFNKLRSLYAPEAADASGGDDDEATPAPLPPAAGQPTPEQLQEIVDELSKGLTPYRDALRLRPSMNDAQTNIRNIEAFIDKLKEEIERLKQQQQNQQNDQPQQNQQQNPDDQQSNQEGQNQPQEGQNNPPSDEPQQGNTPPEPQPGDQPENENQQGDENQQDKPQGNEDQQNEQQQAPPQQNGQQAQPPQPEEAPQRPMSDKEKAEQRAASILKMHMDEEEGSPIPRPTPSVRPPEKDY